MKKSLTACCCVPQTGHVTCMWQVLRWYQCHMTHTTRNVNPAQLPGSLFNKKYHHPYHLFKCKYFAPTIGITPRQNRLNCFSCFYSLITNITWEMLPVKTLRGRMVAIFNNIFFVKNSFQFHESGLLRHAGCGLIQFSLANSKTSSVAIKTLV